MNLVEIQKQFLAAICDYDQRLLSSIESQGLSVKKRIDIYRGSMVGNQAGILEATYPVIKQLVGEECFVKLCYQYIYDTRQGSFDATEFAKPFGRWLSKKDLGANVPYLSDVAMLEWAWQKAFYEKSEPCLNTKTLEAILPEHASDLVFYLQPSCMLLASDYPIDRIWHMHQPNYQGNFKLESTEGVKLLIYQLLHEVVIEKLTVYEWQLLQAVVQGLSLGEIYDVFHQDGHGDVIVELLPSCLTRGWFKDQIAGA